MSFIAKKSDLLFDDKFYGDFKKRMATKLHKSAPEGSSGQSTDPDDELWTQAEVDASDFASHALAGHGSHKDAEVAADSKSKSKHSSWNSTANCSLQMARSSGH